MLPGMTSTTMAALDFLLGRWSGSGWHRRGESPAVHFTQTEDVVARLDGELITVEGLGVRADGSGEVVHRAFAVAWHEPEAGYRWEAFSAGRRLETTLHVEDHAFAWSMSPTPGVTLVYRAEVDGDVWTETGELHAADTAPTRVMEMTLHRARR